MTGSQPIGPAFTFGLVLLPLVNAPADGAPVRLGLASEAVSRSAWEKPS
jgi:hypothetical protein